MKLLKTISATILICLLLTGCANIYKPTTSNQDDRAVSENANAANNMDTHEDNANDNNANENNANEDNTNEDNANDNDLNNDSEFDNVLGLTKEQRLEDYKYLMKTLKDSYLFMGVRDRENPDDLSEDIFKDYQKMIEESDSDSDFYTAVNSTFYRLGVYGHLHLYEPDEYNMVKELYDSDPEYREHWQEVLDSPVSQKCYENIQKLLDSYDEDGNGYEMDEKSNENITTLMIDQNIAYIKIDSFFIDNDQTYQSEKKKLFSFYNKLGGCKDLIIDITDNGGGSEEYWQDLLVAPFIEKTLSCTNYALLADSENNRPYIDNVFEPEELIPISKLPDLPELNRDGLENAAYYNESTLKVIPAKHRVSFNGRIWLLVSPNVYSASESFAVFCKATGFAVIVGRQTGGDGIGALDPVLLQLPNSGLIAQYTMMFGLNPDGSSSEEMGTTPDIITTGTETPLITALREISKFN